jgi:hypothetical protein
VLKQFNSSNSNFADMLRHFPGCTAMDTQPDRQHSNAHEAAAAAQGRAAIKEQELVAGH